MIDGASAFDDDLPRFRWRRPDRVGPSRRRRGGHRRLLVPLLAVPFLWGALPASAEPVAPTGDPAATEVDDAPTDPLAGSVAAVPEVVEARARHDRAVWRVEAGRQAASDLEWQAVALAAEQANLDAGQRELASRLTTARVRAREALVSAYIGGRPADLTAVLFSTESATDVAFRTELLTRHVEQRADTVHEYVELEAQLDGAVADLAERIADNQIAREQAAVELANAEAEVTAAADDLLVVESRAAVRVQIEAQQALRRSGGPYKAAGSDGSPTPEQSGNAKGLAWDLLRNCESGGNYAAVSATGAFRGAYQFHMTTWHMLGGVGDPIDALTADQDYRAQLLYDMLGAKPWPECGRYLRMTPEQLQAVVTGVALPDPAEEAAGSSSTTSSTEPTGPSTSPTSSGPTTAPSSTTTTVRD